MQPQQKLLILGCGDIGQRLAQCLPQDAYTVTGLRRNPPADLPHLRYQACDAANAEALGDVLKQDFVVIVISMTPNERSDSGYERAYVRTCQNLVKELHRQSLKPRLLIFVSSSAVYAQVDAEWVDENSPVEPEGFSGKRLLEAEAIVQTSGYTHTIVRFSGIYGPGRNRLIEQVRQGKASASTHFTNRIHADDCARVLVHLIGLNSTGKVLQPVYLASDNEPTPMVEVVTWLAEQMGIENPGSDAAVNERGNKRCNNKRLLDSGFVFRYLGYRDGYAAVLAACE